MGKKGVGVERGGESGGTIRAKISWILEGGPIASCGIRGPNAA